MADRDRRDESDAGTGGGTGAGAVGGIAGERVGSSAAGSDDADAPPPARPISDAEAAQLGPLGAQAGTTSDTAVEGGEVGGRITTGPRGGGSEEERGRDTGGAPGGGLTR